jgi:hypothetical protein
MARTTTEITEVAATGSDGNAGSDGNSGTFDPSTNTANMITDMTTNSSTGNTSTPVVSTATFNFVAGDASAWLYMRGGSGWTLPSTTSGAGVTVTPNAIFAKISSVASNKATLDAAIGHVELWQTGAELFGQSTVVGVSTQATPTSGVGSIDYSRTGTPIVSAANLASSNGTNATPTVTSSSRTFDKRDIGDYIYVSAGTNWTTGIFRITNTSAGGAILDRACGSSASLSSGTFVEGGCLASPGMAGFFYSSQDVIFIKSATYTVTSATANVTVGCMSISGAQTRIVGYNAYRHDNPKTTSRPTLLASGIATFTLVTLASGASLLYAILDGASLTSSRAVSASGQHGSQPRTARTAGSAEASAIASAMPPVVLRRVQDSSRLRSAFIVRRGQTLLMVSSPAAFTCSALR